MRMRTFYTDADRRDFIEWLESPATGAMGTVGAEIFAQELRQVRELRARVVAHHNIGDLSDRALSISLGTGRCHICERAIRDQARADSREAATANTTAEPSPKDSQVG